MPRRARKPDPAIDLEARIAELKNKDDGFERYCRECVKIASKGGALIPLELNFTQRYILREIREARARGHAPRLICLKSRQVGVSTFSTALQHYCCHLWPHRSGLVLAHKDAASKNLFRMARRMWLNMPPELHEKPKQKTLREIHFSNDSRMQVEAVGDVRSYTAQYVHLSEMAFFEDGKATLDAILQTVPNHIDSLVIIESTANGVGNAFHNLWSRSVRNIDKTRETGIGFIPIFIPWYRHHEYRMQPWFLPNDLSGEETILMEKYQLDLHQVAWRRWCIETNCGGDEERFKVEYPSTSLEAFLLSGRPVFDADGMSYYMGTVPPAVPEETLPRPVEIDWVEETKQPLFTEAVRGRLSIFTPPQNRHTYIIGADPSEGDPGSCPSPLEVLDQMTLDQVAEWHGKAPPDLLARYAFALGMHYNTALIVNEANNHGIQFHNTLLQMNYPNVYFRTTTEESVAGAVTLKPGWYQTNRNKHLIFDTFRQYVREKHRKYIDSPTRRLRSPILVSEMSTAIYSQKEGNPQTMILPQSGSEIDTVIAFAMPLFIHRGTATSPLEPLPVADLVSAAYQVALKREKDREGSERLSVDLTGMTCEELSRVLEIRYLRKQRGRTGMEAMR